ncbi:invasion associated locus B family protein [Hyphomonas sp.]|uniref:invasion associated locus B family protein n=1 Tax=Hyphomonas sp. TaxID=87 RepID=UPI00391A2EAB
MSTQRVTVLRSIIFAIVIAPLLALPAQAERTAVGRFKDWVVFTDTVNGQDLCYAATEATSKTPSSANHGAVWYYVTTWKSGAATAQPSVRVGYDFREGSSPKTKVGRSSWTLFTSGREAFADDKDDKSIVEALRKGANLSFEGTSARGTNVSYRFSLSGSAAAIDKSIEACR